MSERKLGTLYLIPTVIAPATEQKVLPPDLVHLCSGLNYYLAENIRTARRCLSAMQVKQSISDIRFEELNKNTSDAQIAQLLQPLLQGENVGIMSEAGCPGIADPGARAVAFAHEKGIQVVPYVGPSSIFLALMASGFSGQSFAFSGYLPIDKKGKQQAIKQLENKALKNGETQLFMETPYRNNQLLKDLIQSCNPSTLLCIAKNISGDDEFIATKSIKDWGKTQIDLHKVPCIFVLGTTSL